MNTSSRFSTPSHFSRLLAHCIAGCIVGLSAMILLLQSASAQSFPAETIMNNGPRSNRVNLVYLPDGYTSSELSTFSVHARNMNTALFATSPFKEYRAFFNASLVHVPSAQSGVLHPKTAPDCPTAMPVSSPNTYFETTFDYVNIHRLVVPKRTDKINTVLAASVPDFDQAFVVANSTEYGGSGGTYPAATGGNTSSFEVMIHELGHSFAYLADEYWAGPQYAIEKPNMTANSNATTNKWNYWVGRGNIGIFTYSGSNAWFRPTQNSQCKMEALGRPFCSVCAEALVLKIHTLVDVIQAVSPTNFNTLTAPASGTIAFSLTLLKPDPNTLTVRWLLNGAQWGSANAESATIPVQNLVIGANSLTAEVVDATAMIRPANQPKRTVTWTINRTVSGVATDISTGGLSIFPNPAEANFVVQYEASCVSASATLDIADMTGKLLLSKNLGAQAQGQHRVALDAIEAQLPEGAYLVSITTDCARQTGKMLVSRKR